MPKARAAATLVVSAAKWRAISVPPWASNHALAEAALVMVSMVVKVLLAIRNSVRSGRTCFNTASSSWPSTFDTKWKRRPGSAKAASASTAITVAGSSTRPSAALTPSALPRARSRRLTPRLSTCRNVPCSRSPENAEKVIKTMNSGRNTCSTSAPVISPKRWTAVRSWAGRNLKSFCLCASSHTATPM